MPTIAPTATAMAKTRISEIPTSALNTSPATIAERPTVEPMDRSKLRPEGRTHSLAETRKDVSNAQRDREEDAA